MTLNRPEKKNALSIELREAVTACLDGWAQDDAVGVVVITGAGAAFSAGFDLNEFAQPELMPRVFESSARYHRAVFRYPKPTIAAVNGVAFGGGLDLATLCDVRIASTSASFKHPEIKLGGPPLFTPLRWIVGEGRAREICLTGRAVTADEAHRIGLVTEVVEPERLRARSLALAAAILEAPAATLAATKRAMNAAGGRGFEESFVIEHDDVFRRALTRGFGV